MNPMPWIRQHPERTLALLTGLCLLTFLATLPLPRIDQQLVGSDGARYYVYLPSFWLDGDLDFSDEYAYFFAYDPEKAAALLQDRTARGVPANQWPIGPALFWSPFFLLAHLVVLLAQRLGASIPADGYGYVYQTFVLAGSILYGGAGLVLIYRWVCRLTSSQAALVATILIGWAGNLVYYMTAEPYMAHTLSVFASGLFFTAWWSRRDQTGVKTAALYGLLGGMMALIRPQDGLFLSLPFLARLPRVGRALWADRSVKELLSWLRDAGVAGVTAALVFSPQLLVWGAIYGNYWRSPYTYYPGQTFYWLSPQLGAVLFSAFRGLFVWHPVFLFALLGLFFTWRRNHTLAWVGLAGFLLQWYLISSWHNWAQGDAFGGRMFIVCTPIFVMGLAHLIEWVTQRWSWNVVYGIGAGLLVWNFLLFIEYRFDLVTAQRPPTWHDLTLRRLTFWVTLLQRWGG